MTDITKFLVELSKSKDPQAMMDTTFKKENTDPMPDAEVLFNEMTTFVCDNMFNDPWMNDVDRSEAKEMLMNDIKAIPFWTDLRNSINDGINRGYDMVKYMEFIKIVTISMARSK